MFLLFLRHRILYATVCSAKSTLFRKVCRNSRNAFNEVVMTSRLSMVNIWATWCSPCCEELPALGRISREYSGRLNVIGIQWDADTEEGIAEGKRLFVQSGASYVNLVPNNGIWQLINQQNVEGIPTTWFIDQAGNIVREVVGPQSYSAWKGIVDQLLAAATPSLAKPTISSVAVSGMKATLKWSAVSGADGYELYRKKDSANFKLLKKTSDISYIDTDLVIGSTYSYKVRAYQGALKSAFSTVKTIKPLAAPIISSAKASGTSVVVKWQAVSGAVGYEVWCAKNGGKYTLLKKTDTLSYKHTGLRVGSTYVYRVKSYNGMVKSALSAAKSVTIK